MARLARLAVVTIVLAAAAVVWLWHRGPRPEHATPRSVTPTAASAPETNAPSSKRAEAQRPPATERSDTAATPPKIEPPPSEAPHEREHRFVQGTIVVVDSDGGEHATESGRMTATTLDGDQRIEAAVEVAAGRFTLDVLAGARLEFRDATLGGRETFVEHMGEPFRVPESGLLELRARLPAPRVLHVLSAADRHELADVELASGFAFDGAREAHPGPLEPGQRVASGLRSPIDLEAVLAPLAEKRGAPWPYGGFYARSPGFAWGRVVFDRSRGGERTVLLDAGGDLEVVLAGDVDLTDAFLFLRSPGGRRSYLVVRLAKERTVLVESARAGPYRVSVDGPQLAPLEPADVEIVSGVRSSLTIALAAREAPKAVTFSGVARIPAVWKVSRPLLSVECVGPPQEGPSHRRTIDLRVARAEGDCEVYDWSAAGVVPGICNLELEQPRHSMMVIVPESGRADVVFDVPPPGHVSLRVIDAASHDDARIDEVSWAPPSQPYLDSPSYVGVQRNDDTHRFEFDAPLGEIEVSVWSPLYERSSWHLGVRAGENSSTLEVRRCTGIRVRVLDGERVVRWRDAWRVRPTEIGGDGEACSWMEDAGTEVIGVTKPGRYRFAFPTIDGYAPVPEQEVVVEPGKLADCVIHLERDAR